MKILLFFLIVIIQFSIVFGDCYLQNPRGSNDRLNGAGANRNNGNRLFDTQNNAKGGYCWGPKMYFYTESIMSIEWTVQHGCGNKNLKCNMVLQYSCNDNYHDGATTDTIPYDDDEQVFQNCKDPGASGTDCPSYTTVANDGTTFKEREYEGDTLREFGIHESYIFYKKCDTRRRNKRLFAADQNLGDPNTAPARRTRQNPNGNRRGLECPEERDYYPYWHPTPWVDIAVLVDDEDSQPGCNFYTKHSQNVEKKGECIKETQGNDPSDDFIGKLPWWEKKDEFNTEAYVFNTQETCENANFQWIKRDSWDVSAPECKQNVWSRDNHLGNVAQRYGAFAANYNWTLPKGNKDNTPHIGENCIFRIRYNISSTDYDGWNTDGSVNGKELSPVVNDPYLSFGPEDADKLEKLSEGENGLATGSSAPFNLSLAIDTTQFARTFQDRTHLFSILKRPKDISSDAKIYNLNVRGKRGNIVQTYPATEYDFAPNELSVALGDYIHFQWTGCDTNPANNDGEGKAQTDRSNIVFMKGNEAGRNHHDEWTDSKNFFGKENDRFRFAHLDQGQEGMPFECASYDELIQDNNRDQRDDNCMKLNAAKVYFDGGLHKVTSRHEGTTYHYMSSRNNNFTNRSQKGSITAETGPFLEEWVIALAGVVLGLLSLAIIVPAGIFGPWIVTSVIGGAFSKIG